jgi:hypothetical protein
VAQIAVNAYVFKSVKSDIGDEKRTSDARKPAHSGNNRTKVGTVFLPHIAVREITRLRSARLFFARLASLFELPVSCGGIA